MSQLLEALDRRARERSCRLDPQTQRERGVVHTPPLLAQGMVTRLDRALREHLGIEHGVVDPRVRVFDPATGPGVFLGAVMSRVTGASLPAELRGFDIDADAICDATSILEPAARAIGCRLVLEPRDALSTLEPFGPNAIADEVRVVLGNPPWSARSANRTSRSDSWLADFYVDAQGAPLRERKSGVLSDDYVRFFRYATELSLRAPGPSAVCLVTNGSYLDGRVHRGMRAFLERSFDRIEVLDLGGSALVERARGIRDENVFGVRPSVAIFLGLRMRNRESAERRARMSITRLVGGRSAKLEAIDADTPTTAASSEAAGASWKSRHPAHPAYLGWPSLEEWMPFHREGVQTNRDRLCVAPTEDELRRNLEEFLEGRLTLPHTRHFDTSRATERARALLEHESQFRKAVRAFAYRPGVQKLVLIDNALCHRPRPELIAALDREPFALLTTRCDRGEAPWAHWGVARYVADNSWLSSRSSCRTRMFPLCDPSGASNFVNQAAFPIHAGAFALWALALLVNDRYRECARDALKDALPRIPAPRDRGELDRGVEIGRQIAEALERIDESASIDTPSGSGVSIGHHRIEATELAQTVDRSRELDPYVSNLLRSPVR